MFCFIKYIDYDTFQMNIDTENPPDVKPLQIATNKELIINPNCPIKIIMDYVLKQVGLFEEDKVVDLASERCSKCNISKYPPDTNGLSILKSKAIYYIVFPSFDDLGNLKELTPMLNQYSREYADFFIVQQKRRSSSRRFSSLRSSRSSKSSKNASLSARSSYSVSETRKSKSSSKGEMTQTK